MDCDLFGVLEETIDALEPISEDPVIEICFRKNRNSSEVICRLRPFSSEAPEFIGVGKTYRAAMFKLIESLYEYAKHMSQFPPPLK